MKLNLRRIGATSVTTLVLGATLAACSAGDGTEASGASDTSTSQEGSASTEHSPSDVEFAQMMIIHHQGAVEMAELASQKAENAQVQELADRIAAAQQPEIDTMTGWLEAWGEDIGGTTGTDHAGHAGMDMNGMTQEEVMAHLETLEGAEFDSSFVEHMIAHHQGAVTMAETEVREGGSTDAIGLAETIIEDQTAEISEMEQLATSVG